MVDTTRQVLEAMGREAGWELALEPFVVVEGRTVWRFVVVGDEALDVWAAFRARADAVGHWPVLVGDGVAAERLAAECEATAVAPSHILTYAEGAYRSLIAAERRRRDGAPEGPGSALTTWVKEHPAGGALDDLRAALAAPREQQRIELPPPPAEADWPFNVSPARGIGVATDRVTGAPLEHVFGLLVPTAAGHEVPAWLRFGGFNACPTAHRHVAQLARWGERYQAELVALSADTIEVQVDEPPRERAAAWALALEQAAYCEDIVEQGCGSVEALAALLLGGTSWLFWWD